MKRKRRTGRDAERIVSAPHPVSEYAAELSGYEYGLIVAGNAFNSWMVHCMVCSTSVRPMHSRRWGRWRKARFPMPRSACALTELYDQAAQVATSC